MAISTLKARLHAFLLDEEGLATVEYAVAGSLIGVALVAAFPLLGRAVAEQIFRIADLVENLS